MQLDKQKIYLFSGVGLALIALLMIKVYLDQQRQAADALAAQKFKKMQANQSSILVAKTDIPKGTAVEPDDLVAEIIPNPYVAPQAVTSLDRISGMVTIAPISKGEQLTLSKLSYAKDAGGGLAEVTPAGKRAITVSISNIAGLAGMIKAGDYVDVIALVPQAVQTTDGKQANQLAVLPLFQNILVLAVDKETRASPKEDLRYRKEAKQETVPLITLALTPQEASLIAFVQEQGSIRLTMRSPQDSKVEPAAPPVGWDTLLQYVYPQRANQEEQHEPSDYVEIYRGLNKEKVLLSK